jgi:uncharacterized protein (TIGR03382 family)
VELGLDPLNPDTDGGGVPDGEEVQRGSDPLDPSDDQAFTTEPPEALSGRYLGGCGCASTDGGLSVGWLLLLLGVARRRR